jgi:hypothetical protein
MRPNICSRSSLPDFADDAKAMFSLFVLSSMGNATAKKEAWGSQSVSQSVTCTCEVCSEDQCRGRAMPWEREREGGRVGGWVSPF